MAVENCSFSLPPFPVVPKIDESQTFSNMIKEINDAHEEHYESAIKTIEEAGLRLTEWTERYQNIDSLKEKLSEIQLKEELFQNIEEYETKFRPLREKSKEILTRLGDTFKHFQISPLDSGTLSTLQKLGFEMDPLRDVYLCTQKNHLKTREEEWQSVYSTMENLTTGLKQQLNVLAKTCKLKNQPSWTNWLVGTAYFNTAREEFLETISAKKEKVVELNDEKEFPSLPKKTGKNQKPKT